jgi:hypothetical protein
VCADGRRQDRGWLRVKLGLALVGVDACAWSAMTLGAADVHIFSHPLDLPPYVVHRSSRTSIDQCCRPHAVPGPRGRTVDRRRCPRLLPYLHRLLRRSLYRIRYISMSLTPSPRRNTRLSCWHHARQLDRAQLYARSPQAIRPRSQVYHAAGVQVSNSALDDAVCTDRDWPQLRPDPADPSLLVAAQALPLASALPLARLLFRSARLRHRSQWPYRCRTHLPRA